MALQNQRAQMFFLILNCPFGDSSGAPRIMSSKPSAFMSPAKLNVLVEELLSPIPAPVILKPFNPFNESNQKGLIEVCWSQK